MYIINFWWLSHVASTMRSFYHWQTSGVRSQDSIALTVNARVTKSTLPAKNLIPIPNFASITDMICSLYIVTFAFQQGIMYHKLDLFSPTVANFVVNAYDCCCLTIVPNSSYLHKLFNQSKTEISIFTPFCDSIFWIAWHLATTI